ncbi:MAG: thiamine-phosphate kinase [archaeon]
MGAVQDLGEDRVRDLISSKLDKDAKEMLGYGDDAVAYMIDREQLLVVHTDVLVGSTDILPGMSAHDVGRKAVVMNVSDLISKGAEPMGLLFAWGIPRNYDSVLISEMAEGMNRAAKEIGLSISGGDTSESEDFFLSGTAFGLVRRDRLLRRSSVKVGDIIASTGPFGLTSAAYKILFEGAGVSPSMRERILDAAYRPKIRIAEARALVRKGLVNAGIDSSDGLARSLHWLGRRSHVGFVVDNIPVTEEVTQFALMNKLDYPDLTLYEGGEEYELIFAISQANWSAALDTVAEVGGKLYRIGVATVDPTILLSLRNMWNKQIQDRGWQHFSKWGRMDAKESSRPDVGGTSVR